jgi:hypothetical protein
LSDQIANVRAALGTSDVTEVDPAGVRSSLLAALSQLESRR